MKYEQRKKFNELQEEIIDFVYGLIEDNLVVETIEDIFRKYRVQLKEEED